MNTKVENQISGDQEEFIRGIKGLCKLLGVSRSTALTMKKQIPHYQLPGSKTIRFKKSEVLAALSKNK